MNEPVTNRQIAFMVFAAIVCYGFVNLPNDVADAAGTGGWISIIFTTAIVSLFTYFISYIGYNNENQTLFEYSQKLLGKTMGRIIIIIYIIYYILVFSMLIRAYSEELTMTFFQKTPVWVLSLILMLVTAYALTKNLGTIGRIAEIYSLIAFIGFIIIHIIMITQGNYLNIRPILGSENIINYVKASYKILVPFLGSEILMFIPISKKDNKGLAKYSVLTIVLIGLLYILIAESTIAVVGIEDVVYFDESVFKVLKGIDIPYLEIFRRPDGAYVFFWTLNMSCALYIWSYGVVSLTGKLFKTTHKIYIIISVLILSFILSKIPQNYNEVEGAFSLIGYIGIFTLIVMPTILFIITKVKKDGK